MTTDLVFERLVPDGDGLCVVRGGRLVGEDVAEELSVERGGGRWRPVEVQLAAARRDLVTQKFRPAARLCK